MTDEKPNDPLPITDPNQEPVVFVNQVVGQGFLNGVLNLTFATARFTPTPEGKVDTDLIVAARLRMDLFCATQLRDALDAILAQTMKPGNTEH